MTNTVRTAIFPVAGLGTRFLPATKATPKELLPVLDTPLIQYAIDEARAAGIERMVFVSHSSKPAVERYVMDDLRLRRELVSRGKQKLAHELKEAALDPQDDDVVFTFQEEPKGLGHAVLCARDHVLDGPVAVILPDDLILGTPCLAEMIAAYEGGHMVASMTVAPDQVSKYGVLSVTGQDGRKTRANGMVEKPAPEKAPSQMAVIGRYVLDADIFDALGTQPPGAGNEIQLTDAIAKGAATRPITGFRFSGTRFDCGSKAGMLEATLQLASEDPELSQVLETFMVDQTRPRSAA
ncbi:UTP--glucose-1-phosphate uridylyltransferase [Yoonia sediminilitoris]|uniref:UTP--glucose-1-phosphate uridylyltransferase n=1 Tax=Yoonia sediminilitoris TaxID=1286148 RepID=A0A2T6KMS5_9RHOB|nr:UTP--glucose-1-phosphate uridylyltransferase [Yoonia sediminilitoris]PUB17522.1 UDP-glucose pyrophosphorylase [Yoonia sediminilitoris]RCW97817.1 UDP-glucose pyrophosphorylase [Yoonia sediminilitoris]